MSKNNNISDNKLDNTSANISENTSDKVQNLDTEKIEEKINLSERIIKELMEKENKLIRAIIILLVVFAISLGATALIKMMSSETSADIINPKMNDLRNSLLYEKSRYDDLNEKLSQNQERLEKLRETATLNDKDSLKKKDAINEANKKLGFTKLRGDGIKVTLEDGTDNKALSGEVDPNIFIVHDADILDVVNTLRNAGAEGISVNTQRVVGITPISCIGTVIKINEERIGGPYVISAIGNQDYLESALRLPGGILDILQQYGIKVKLERVKNVELPEYKGVYSTEFIETDHLSAGIKNKSLNFEADNVDSIKADKEQKNKDKDKDDDLKDI